MSKYPFYYEVRFKAFKYDHEKELLEYARPITRIFQDKTPLENRKDAFEAFDEFLSYIEDRLYQTSRGNYIIEQPPFVSQKIKKIDQRRFENYYSWREKLKEYREDISLYLIIDDDRIVKDFRSVCWCSETNEYLIHKVASYEYEEQDIVDTLDMIEVPLYEKFNIDISNMIKTVYHYGLDYSESGEDEEDGAKRTILSTPYVWKTKEEYENRRRLDEESTDNEEDKIKSLTIKAGEKRVTYESLFAEYLVGATDIVIADSYIRQPHQKENFLEFISLIRSLNKHEFIKINLKLITYYSEGLEGQAKLFFDELVETLKTNQDPIHFSYEFKYSHARTIETNTGWRIVLDRGLDIYDYKYSKFYPNKSLIGKYFPENRSCRDFSIEYTRKK